MVTLNRLAILLGQKGDLDGAETMFREQLEQRIELHGPEHPFDRDYPP